MGSVLSRNLVRLLAGSVSDQVMKHGTKDLKNAVLFKCLFAGSAGTVGDARSKIGGGGKISDARFGGDAAVPSLKIHFSGMCCQQRGRVWTQDRSWRR